MASFCAFFFLESSDIHCIYVLTREEQSYLNHGRDSPQLLLLSMFFVWSQELFVNKAIACVPAVGSKESVLGRAVISTSEENRAEADSQASLETGM